MKKEISKKDIIKLIRTHNKKFSKHPNSWRVLSFNRYDIKEFEGEGSICFNVDVRFQHVNYISLIRDFYNSDSSGIVWNKATSCDDFSFVPYLKILIEQLKDDGYLKISKQDCKYNTEYGFKIEYNENGRNESYIDAKSFFSKEEIEILESSIFLTTKGQNNLLFLKDKILSEPIGVLSVIISIVSILISIFNK